MLFIKERRNEYQTELLQKFNDRFPPTSLAAMKRKMQYLGIRQDPIVRREKRAKILRDLALEDGAVIEMKGWMHIKLNGKWAYLHKHKWQEANGPVPAGHHLACIDGNRHNCDPSNWTPLSKTQMMLYALHSPIKPEGVDAETRETLITLAKLKAAMKEART